MVKDLNEGRPAETLDTKTTCQTLDNDNLTHACNSEPIIMPTAPTKLRLQKLQPQAYQPVSVCADNDLDSHLPLMIINCWDAKGAAHWFRPLPDYHY